MKYIITALIVLLVLGILAISPIIAYTTDEVITITVEDKERVVTGSGPSVSSKYLVYTSTGVYENTDSLWYWKWNSADVYNDLEIGETYEVKVYGFRVPFLSWFRNIVEIK